MSIKKTISILLLFQAGLLFAQNSMVGDGFGGRLWYKPYNYNVGSYSAYAVCGDSFQLYGWGTNYVGQLGNGNRIESKTPVKAKGITNVKFFTCGYKMAAIKCDGSGWEWGVVPQDSIPKTVINQVKFVDAGISTVSYIKEDGTIWSTGVNYYALFGNGSTGSSNTIPTPQKMNIVNNAVRVANGEYTTTILLADGTVKTCGWNLQGGLGNNSNKNDSAPNPVTVANLKGIVDIKAASATTIALDSAGDVYRWGYGGSGIRDYVPRKVTQLKNIVAISACCDGYHFLALDSNKNCYGWGSNRYYFGGGHLYGPVDTPILVATDVVDIMAGEEISYIVKSDNSLWAAGGNRKIWMNLPDTPHGIFTKLDPTIAPMYLCKPYIFRRPYMFYDTIAICPHDSVKINNKFYKANTILNDTILVGCSSDTLTTRVIIPEPPILNYQSYSVCFRDTVKVGNHKYTQTGNYMDSLINSNGCDSIITTHLVVNNPSFFIQKTVLCNGDSIAFNNKTYKTAGSYTDTLLNSHGCDSIITFNLEVNNRSYSIQNITRCKNDTFKFNSKAYFISGCYFDTLMNHVNCDSIVSTNLNVIVPTVTNQNFRICEYETVKVGNNMYNKPGNYSDTLKTINGCDSILSTGIYVKVVPKINIQDTGLCDVDGEAIHLSPGSYQTYLWFPNGETMEEIIVTKPGVYIVSVSTFDSCTASDSILVRNNCHPPILIPNVFTINGDYQNDAFDIEIEGETGYDLKIFNRWGQLVYESNTDGIDNDGINWNGALFNKGSACDEGIYYFHFAYKFPNGKSGIYKGDITLLRN